MIERQKWTDKLISKSFRGEKALFWRGDLWKEMWVGRWWLGRNLSSRRNRSFKGLEAGIWHSWQEGNWAGWARGGTAKAKMAKLSGDILALWAWCLCCVNWAVIRKSEHRNPMVWLPTHSGCYVKVKSKLRGQWESEFSLDWVETLETVRSGKIQDIFWRGCKCHFIRNES